MLQTLTYRLPERHKSFWPRSISSRVRNLLAIVGVDAVLQFFLLAATAALMAGCGWAVSIPNCSATCSFVIASTLLSSENFAILAGLEVFL